MSDEIIIQQLKDKEAQLLNELNKVHLALRAFIEDNISHAKTDTSKYPLSELIPGQYETSLTYSSKILFVLHSQGRPMLVDDITAAIHQLEPGLELSKLHKNVSHTLSMLAKYGKVKKHPFNRKIKYSL